MKFSNGNQKSTKHHFLNSEKSSLNSSAVKSTNLSLGIFKKALLLKITLSIISVLIVVALLITFSNQGLLKPAIKAQQSDVVVTATVPAKIYYELTVNPFVNEIGKQTIVTLYLYDEYNDPVTNFDLDLIEIDGKSALLISGNGITDSNGYAYFTLSSDVQDEYSIRAINVTPYERFMSNQIVYARWMQIGGVFLSSIDEFRKENVVDLGWTGPAGTYTYQLNICSDALCNNVLNQIDNIDNNFYQYNSTYLNTKIYFRVRAVNTAYQYSPWSNIVSTYIDTVSPTVIVNNVSTDKTADPYVISIGAEITDQSGISMYELTCVDEITNQEYQCSTKSNTGDTYSFVISIDSLHTDPDGAYYPGYQVCINTADLVGNFTKQCGIMYETPQELLSIDEEEPIIEEPDDGDKPQNPFIPIITDITQATQQVVQAIDQSTTNIIESIGETTSQVVTTTAPVVSTAVTTAFLGFQLANIPAFLSQLFFNLLAILGLRKKGTPYGYVYNSVTKEPVSQAIVRIMSKDGRLVRTEVTDEYGIFTTTLDEGQYYLIVLASGYKYPSSIVSGKVDPPSENIYHGEIFVFEKSAEVVMSIPVDSVQITKKKLIGAKFRYFIKTFISYFMTALLFVLFAYSISVYRIYPLTINLIIILLYIPSLLTLLFGLWKNRIKYGYIRFTNKQPVENLEIGIFERNFNRLFRKRVSDTDGGYRFIIPAGEYVIKLLNLDYDMVDKNGNQIKEVPIKQTRTEKIIVNKDIFVRNKSQTD